MNAKVGNFMIATILGAKVPEGRDSHYRRASARQLRGALRRAASGLAQNLRQSARR
jgi:hypothetical protein